MKRERLRRLLIDFVFARQEVGNEEKKRRTKMMINCVFDREERREEMKGFNYDRPGRQQW